MQIFLIIKIIISAIIIGLVTEIAQKYPSAGGLIAALPITTLIAMFWLYYQQKNVPLITEFLVSVVIGVLISLIFFLIVIFLLKKDINFYISVVSGILTLGLTLYIYQKFHR